jgi:Na+/proline symporter
LVVAAYVVSGGLRSTFIADYLHTVVLIVSILVFSFFLYASGDAVGSPGKLYDLLVEAAITRPTANTNGSYLSFKSIEGIILSMDLLVGGIGTVWLDQAYWQRAIASQPETSVKAYLFGAVAWFGMPISFGTAMGLGCAALTGLPSFPTYPNSLNAAQIGAGLSAPAVAVALLGKGGGALLLLLLFMAVTSSTSAELVAVSSLVTFDIYKTYIKPLATSDELVRSSHYAIIAYSIVLASFCSLANGVHLNLTWLLTVGGIFTGGASFPVGLNLFWPRVSTVATVASCWISGALAILTWFVTTWKRSGEITVATTGIPQNAISGAVVGWLGGLFFAVVLTFIFPGQYSSTDPEHVARNQKIFGILSGDEVTSSSSNGLDQERENTSSEEKGEAKTAFSAAVTVEPIVRTGNDVVDFLTNNHIEPLNERSYKRALRLALGANAFVLPVILVIPLSLFGADYIASRSFFKGYIVVSFGWVWGTLAICVIWPIWESRAQTWAIVKGLAGIFSGKRE